MPESVDSAIAKLTAEGLVAAGKLRGCTEEDIARIETSFGFKLPSTYRELLAVMGRSAGEFLVGTDWLFPAVLTLRDQAERLLRECKAQVALDQADFVFAVHQGYQFLFFRMGKTDDPEVFLYEECEESFKRVANSFSEWFAGCVEDEIAAAKELRGS